MGDDAELYMEMQDPYFWDWVERYNYNYDEEDFSSIQSQKKKNLAVFIDAESIGSSSAARIDGQIKKIGTLFEARYYALQKDNRTSAWKDVAKKYGFKPILLCGEPEKNKIDKKIMRDVRAMLEKNKQVDIFCIVSRDGDFTSLVNELRKKGKRVVILATKQTSKRLRKAANEVKGI